MKKIKLESVFNEFTLMGIAVSGAFYLGEYWDCRYSVLSHR